MKEELYKAWQEQVHASYFDTWANYSDRELRRLLENFNEFRLFLANKDQVKGREFLEVGCATGELYRYLRHYHREFSYRGFDISHPAIEKANRKYSDGYFKICEPDLCDVLAANLKPAIVWARDVVLHQLDPIRYLQSVLQISNEATILRLRTRDKGDTVLDPELSCQWHYNHWVPYIIFNIDELVEQVCRLIPVERMSIIKSYTQLGGWHNRFLPKECYYPETGTAETAIFILRSRSGENTPKILIESREDFSLHVRPHLWRRGCSYILRKLKGLNQFNTA